MKSISLNNTLQNNFPYILLCTTILVLLYIEISRNNISLSSQDKLLSSSYREGFLGIGALWDKIASIKILLTTFASIMEKLIKLPLEIIKLMGKMIELVRMLEKFFNIMMNLPEYLINLVKEIFNNTINNIKSTLFGETTNIINKTTSTTRSFINEIYKLFSILISLPRQILLYILDLFSLKNKFF
jgi:hypothetical protein